MRNAAGIYLQKCFKNWIFIRNYSVVNLISFLSVRHLSMQPGNIHNKNNNKNEKVSH